MTTAALFFASVIALQRSIVMVKRFSRENENDLRDTTFKDDSRKTASGLPQSDRLESVTSANGHDERRQRMAADPASIKSNTSSLDETIA